MHHSLRHFLMYGSMIALIGTTACSTMQASFGDEGGDASSAQQSASNDILQQMAHDSEAGDGGQ